MRVLFPDVKDPVGGKSYFLHLLYKELEKLGIEVVFDGAPHDILFGTIRFRQYSSAKKALRLDGVIHNIRKNWRAKNASMKAQTDEADLIVCQSKFGFEMVKKFVQADMSKAIIIGNGTQLCAPYERPVGWDAYEHNFLAVSKWRPHKRLRDTIESFLHADVKDSCLWVAGKITDDTADYKSYFDKHENVKYLGHVSDRRKLVGYMMEATASMHLCWFDCYPNSVVEAVAAKCPVICTNTGGTREIVEPSGGIVLDLDRPYDYKAVDLYRPPKVDYDKVAQALSDLTKKRRDIKNEIVDIQLIAQDYRRAFENLVA